MSSKVADLTVVAVVGLVLVGGAIYLSNDASGIGGQPAASVTAAPTATPTAMPSAMPSPIPVSSPANLKPGPLCSADYCPGGTLEPGTYAIEAGAYSPRRLTFTVPAGWSIDFNGSVSKHSDAAGGVSFSTWEVTHVFAGVCSTAPGPIAVGPTIEDLASALAAQKGHRSSAVTDITLGGFPARRIEMTLAADACSSGIARIWPGPGPDLNSGFSTGFCCTPGDSTETVYAVDVAGTRVVVVAHHRAASSTADKAELQAVIDSIVFGSPTASPSPAP